MHKLFEIVKSITMASGENKIKDRMTLSCSKNFNHTIINDLVTSGRLNRTPTELTISASYGHFTTPKPSLVGNT